MFDIELVILYDHWGKEQQRGPEEREVKARVKASEGGKAKKEGGRVKLRLT